MLGENIFPSGKLLSSLPGVVKEVRDLTLAPEPMIAAVLLSTISLACQGVIDVRRMEGLTGPTSLNFIIVAQSGERKSTVEKLLMSPLYQFEQEQYEDYLKKIELYDHKMEVFKVQKKTLLAEIRTNTRKGKDIKELTEQLQELQQLCPEKPKKFKLIFNDVTPAAIKANLCENHNSIGLMSHEGGAVFDGYALRDLPFINQMWDATPVSVQRKNTDDILIKDARLTLSLMVQPEVLKKYMDKNGGVAKGIGFLARCFICQPCSTQGYRIIEKRNTSTEKLQEFHKRLMKIIKESIAENEKGQKRCLRFTPEAEKLWIDFSNDAERAMRACCLLSEFKDYASKMADNMARVAALLHYFGEYPGDISVDAVNSAIAICLWFGDEHIRLFKKKDDLNIVINDEGELWSWINDYCNKNIIETGKFYIKKNDILQFGPSRFRNKKRLNEILERLFNNHRIEIGRENRTVVIKPIILNESLGELLDGIDI